MTIRSFVALALFSVVAGCGGSKNLGSKMDAASDARPSDAGARDGQVADAPVTDAPVTDAPVADGATPDVTRDGAADKPVTDGQAPDVIQPDAVTADSAPGTDAPAPTPDTAPPTDTPSPDTATPDTAVDTAPGTDASSDGGSTTGIDGPLVTTCPGNVPLSAACALYCAGITASCTGLSAQYASEAECVGVCIRPTWPCGAPGQTGDTLACRLAQLVPLASQPELAPLVCPNAGLNSIVCR